VTRIWLASVGSRYHLQREILAATGVGSRRSDRRLPTARSISRCCRRRIRHPETSSQCYADEAKICIASAPDVRITEKFCASGADENKAPPRRATLPIARLEISYDADCPRLWPLQAKLPLFLNRTTNRTALVPHHPIPVSLSVKIEDR
jgi:hypothetical protein